MTHRHAPTLSVAIVLPFSLVAGILAQSTPHRPPAPGRLVDIGGHRLHLHCAGRGSPTVVIDGGVNTWSIHYSHIQKALSGTGRVCTYDRAGMGWSDVGPAPRTSARLADELHRLLRAAAIDPPLLLVGHSLGGYNVRVYQSRYPDEVAGLVLVEAAHPQQWERLPPEWAAGVKAEINWLRGQAARIREGRIDVAAITPGAFTRRVPEWREAHVAAQLSPALYETRALEMEAVFDSARQVDERPLGRLPVVVLSARRSFDLFAGTGLDTAAANPVWLELQAELARLSSRTSHLFSDGNHALHESDPEAVIAAVRLGLNKVRATH